MFQEAYSQLLAAFGGPGFHPEILCAENPEVPAVPAPVSIASRSSDREAWLESRRSWRRRLCGLLLSPEASGEDAVACAVALAEEGRWSLAADRRSFDEPSRPDIDLFAAQTGELLAWTSRRFAEPLGAAGVATLRSEARRRLFAPCMTQEGYGFLRGAGADALGICASLLISVALLENDATRFARLARVLLKALDACVTVKPGCLRTMRETAGMLASLADLNDLFGFDVSEALADGLDEVLCAWVDGDRLLDPAGKGIERGVSGMDIYRAGEIARDAAACRLGRYMLRQRELPSSTVSGRLLSGALEEGDAQDKPPRLRCGASRENLRMLSRTRDFFCAMNGAAGQGNVGDVQLFSGGNAVLSGQDGLYSVPLLAGQEQLSKPRGDCPCSFEMQDARETLSVDMTNAYPEACGLRSCQRTLMISRPERSIRWVDAVAFREPQELCFRFLCREKPSVFSTAIRFGGLRLTWEGDLRAEARPLRDGRTLLTLRPSAPASRGLYAFTFDWADYE